MTKDEELGSIMLKRIGSDFLADYLTRILGGLRALESGTHGRFSLRTSDQSLSMARRR